MNLRAMANSITSSINPNVDVIIKKYDGKTLAADGMPVITYTTINAIAQMQPELSYRLQHLQGFTQGGVYRAFYFNEDLKGVSAPSGNDFILVGSETYKVIEQQEGWYQTSGWTKVIAQRTEDFVEPEEPVEPEETEEQETIEEGNGTNN